MADEGLFPSPVLGRGELNTIVALGQKLAQLSGGGVCIEVDAFGDEPALKHEFKKGRKSQAYDSAG